MCTENLCQKNTTLQPCWRGSNPSTPAWTKLVNVAGTAPSCGEREFIRTHIGVSWLSGAALHLGRRWKWKNCDRPAELVHPRWIDLPSRASRFNDEHCRCSRLCGSRVNCLEPCRSGSILVNRTAYDHAQRARWWGLDVTKQQSQKSPRPETLTGR